MSDEKCEARCIRRNDIGLSEVLQLNEIEMVKMTNKQVTKKSLMTSKEI